MCYPAYGQRRIKPFGSAFDEAVFSGKHDELQTQLRILPCRRQQRWDSRSVPTPMVGGGLQAAVWLGALPAKPPASHEWDCCPQTAHGEAGKAPVLLLLPPNNLGQGSLKARAGVHPAGDSTCTALSLQNELRCY